MRSRLLLALAIPTFGATACVDYEMHTSKDPIVEESEALQTTDASATPETPDAPEPCADDPAPQLLSAAPEDGQVLSIDASVVLDDAEEGPDAVRVFLSPESARQFATRSHRVISAGRPPCPLCDEPLDPAGHICVRTNGYRRGALSESGDEAES